MTCELIAAYHDAEEYAGEAWTMTRPERLEAIWCSMKCSIIYFMLHGGVDFRRRTQTLPSGAVIVAQRLCGQTFVDPQYAHLRSCIDEVTEVAESWNWSWCGGSYPGMLPIQMGRGV